MERILKNILYGIELYFEGSRFILTSKEINHYVKNWYWCKWKTVSLKFDATSKEKMELNIIINYVLLIFYAVVACPGRGKHSNNGNIESNHSFPHIAINK